MDRLSTFAANVTAPVIRAALAGKSTEAIIGIAEEVLLLACPNCGHITPDHRWTPDENGQQGCLVPGCPCADIPVGEEPVIQAIEELFGTKWNRLSKEFEVA